jgi:uncharacterized protein (TIGR03437 family)
MTFRVLLAGALVTTIAVADPLMITVSGTANGQLGTNSFSSSAFTFILRTDTTLLKTQTPFVFPQGPDLLGLVGTPRGTPTTFTIAGVGSGTFMDDQQVFVDPNQRPFGGAIGFAHFQDVVLVAIASPKLVGYDLMENIGPLTGPTVLASPGTSFQSSAGPLSISLFYSVTFNVVVNPAPSPVTPTITGIALPAGNPGAPAAPGTPILITGMNLGASSSDVAAITIGGKASPVLNFVSSSSILAQVPVEVTNGTPAIVATYKNEPSPPFSVTVAPLSPAVYDSAGMGCIDSTGNRITTSHPAIVGTSVRCIAIGLGATNPPMVTGVKATMPAPTTASVQLMLGGKLVQPDYAGLLVGSITDYSITFKVPPDAPIGNEPLFLTIGGKQSNTITLAIGAPTPTISAIVNGATFRNASAAPNSFVSIFGTNFGTQDTPTNIFPALDFAGVSVLFNGVAAPLYYVFGSLGQINLVLPSEIPESGTVMVQVKTPQSISTPFPLQMSSANVGMFRIPDPSNPKRNNGAVLLTNTAWRIMPLSMAAALGFNECDPATAYVACGQPAKSGDVIQIFLTGLGKATAGGDPGGAPLATGTVAPTSGNPLYMTLQQPSVTIGGVPAVVSFSGIAPGNAGLYQIDVTIPDGIQPNDDVPIVITMPNGSSDTVTIAVQRS